MFPYLLLVKFAKCCFRNLASRFFIVGTFLRTEHDAEQESSIFACVQRCVAKSGCKSINYKRQGGGGHNCFLNKKNRREAGEAAIETDKNFVHYDIDYHVQRSEEPEFGTADINVVSGKTLTKGYFVYKPFKGTLSSF